jgi:hypothetical protein
MNLLLHDHMSQPALIKFPLRAKGKPCNFWRGVIEYLESGVIIWMRDMKGANVSGSFWRPLSSKIKDLWLASKRFYSVRANIKVTSCKWLRHTGDYNRLERFKLWAPGCHSWHKFRANPSVIKIHEFRFYMKACPAAVILSVRG